MLVDASQVTFIAYPERKTYSGFFAKLSSGQHQSINYDFVTLGIVIQRHVERHLDDLETSGAMWSVKCHLEPSGAIRSHLASSGAIWSMRPYIIMYCVQWSPDWGGLAAVQASRSKHQYGMVEVLLKFFAVSLLSSVGVLL